MADQLQHIADTIAHAAGWKQPEADSEGIFHFSLEGDLDFRLFSPEGRTAILWASLGKAPDRTPEGESEVLRLAGIAAGSLVKRKSIFSLGETGLELHRSFSLAGTGDAAAVMEARDFLNDLAWWQRQVSGSASSARTVGTDWSSPFSLNFNSFFSGK